MAQKHDDVRTNMRSVVSTMTHVNSFFQLHNPTPNNDWTGGVYMLGNLAHMRVSGNSSLLDFAVSWGDSHRWSMTGYRGCIGDLGCPDNIVAGQAYAEISLLKGGNTSMRAGIVAAVNNAVRGPACEVASNYSQKVDSDRCWWWIDALFMALPTFARVGALTLAQGSQGSNVSASKMFDYARLQYNVTVHGTNASGGNAFNLWDPVRSLFLRDDSFVGRKTPNGNGVFWSRGNGWAFAALVRALEALPVTRVADRAEYRSKFVAMASSLVALQGVDGCWRTSLEDAAQFPMIETSGTSLIVYGLAWGVNQHVLESAKFRIAAQAGWSCMSQFAVMSSGQLGYCQGGGSGPQGNGRKNSTSDFCVGSFLLAGSEMTSMVGSMGGR